MEPLLRVTDLNISFPKDKGITRVTINLNFSVNPHEFVALVGESGSGKSITALSILKLLPADARIEGDIFFSGNRLLKSEKKIYRGQQIGMIFQEPMTSLNPLMTCGEQVMETIRKHLQLSGKEARKKTLELFKKVELPEPEILLDRYPHQLSGGQKQRVMIAIAISCEPLLLIADEPTTALDVRVQQTILNLLKKLSKETGLAVLLITHDLGVVADYAERVIVMQQGRIVEEGMTTEVLQHPREAYTKALIACRPASNEKSNYLPVVSEILSGHFTVKKKNRKEINYDSTVLSVESLDVHYGVKKGYFAQEVFHKAVDDVSFKVYEREIVGLVGESGCGKTTLGKAILQLVKSSAGKVMLKGTDLASLPESRLRQARKEIQVVFQDPYGSLNPVMKIGDAIREPLDVHRIGSPRVRHEKVVHMLRRLELDPAYYSRYPHEFSGGQRQRICIARALILEPSFVVFDESVSALDVSVQAGVLNLITRLQEEMKFSCLFISHDLSVVHYISDRILVMRKGKLVEEGTAEQVYKSPKNEYTLALVEAIPGRINK